MKTLVVAGKGLAATSAINELVGTVKCGHLAAVPNSSATEKDYRQPSFTNTCRELGVPLINIEEVMGDANLVLFSLEYDKILSVSEFESNLLFNFHFSLLPKYRGVYTSVFPILNGESWSGVSVHRMTAGVDDGPLIRQREFRLSPEETAFTLHWKHHMEAASLFSTVWPSLVEGDFEELAQDDAQATTYERKSIDLRDTEINLFQPAESVARKVRAFFFPEYQCATFEGLSVKRVELMGDRCLWRPGQVLSRERKAVVATTLDRVIRLTLG